MLVLTRKRDETVWLGREVSLTVRDIQAGQVSLELAQRRPGPNGADDAESVTCTHVLQIEPHGPPAEPQGATSCPAVYMPVRTSKPLQLDGGVTVTVEGMGLMKGQPARVRLGIRAPRDLQIVRDEIKGRYFAE
jgi:sRNA-binding carbon storage regulator CsrA